MHLYVLSLTDAALEKLSAGAEECRAMVVRAKNEETARAYAYTMCGDEPTSWWLNRQLSTCTLLQASGGKSGVILRDVAEK